MKKHHSTNWRDYQRHLKRKQRDRKIYTRLPLLAVFTLCALGGMWLIISWGTWFEGVTIKAGLNPERGAKSPESLKGELDFKNLLRDQKFDITQLDESFYVENDGARFKVTSFIESGLQKYILRLLKRSMTRQAAVVALDPANGRILAMASYSDTDEPDNICVAAEYPAASLFKIISAAAAMEKAGFTPEHPVFYNGRKYTLYKNQLKRTRNKFTAQTTFKNAFATSINSVFGKLGMDKLGQNVLMEYAEKFLFNRTIDFDMPVAESIAWVPENEYGLAESACGFNKKTLISPLHAAMLAAAVANDGSLMMPRLVDSISSESGELLYINRPSILTSPIKPATAQSMKKLMRETTLYGTCRNFRKLRRNKAFRNVDMGAKTGTINDIGDQFKYDWLTAYGLSEDGKKSICISVLGIHGERLGIRANELGKMILNYYFTS